MAKVNIISRMIKSISDFNFSNHFIKEKMSKSIGLLFFGYLIFVLVFGVYVMFSVNPVLNDLSDAFDSQISDLPDFQLYNGEFEFEDGRTYFEKELDGMFFAVDLENKHELAYYQAYPNFVVFKDGQVYMNSDVPTPLQGMQAPITKDSIKTLLKAIVPMMYVGLAIGAVLGIGFMFVLSAVNWVIAIVINSAMKRELSSSDLYKVTAHAMVLPGLLMLINWLVPFTIPMFFFIYLALTGFYSFMFIKSYQEEDIELESIYE